MGSGLTWFGEAARDYGKTTERLVLFTPGRERTVIAARSQRDDQFMHYAAAFFWERVFVPSAYCLIGCGKNSLCILMHFMHGVHKAAWVPLRLGAIRATSGTL